MKVFKKLKSLITDMLPAGSSKEEMPAECEAVEHENPEEPIDETQPEEQKAIENANDGAPDKYSEFYFYMRAIEELKFGKIDSPHKFRTCDETPLTLKYILMGLLEVNPHAVVGCKLTMFDGDDLSLEYIKPEDLPEYVPMSIFVQKTEDGKFVITDKKWALFSFFVRVVDGYSQVNCLLQPSSIDIGNSIFSSVRVTSMFPTGPAMYRCECTYFLYDSLRQSDFLSQINRMRVSAIHQDIWHYKLTDFNKFLIGELPSYALDDLVTDMLKKGEKAKASIYADAIERSINHDLFYRGLSKKLREKYSKLIYNACSFHQNLGDYDLALYYYQKARNFNLPMNESIEQRSKEMYIDGATEGLRYDNVESILHTVMHVNREDPICLRIFSNHVDDAEVKGAENVWNFDIISFFAQKETGYAATLLMPLKNDTIIIMRAKKTGSNSVAFTFMRTKPLNIDTAYEGRIFNIAQDDTPASISLTFCIDEPANVNKFKEIRQEVTRKIMDGEEVSLAEELMVGKNEDIHYDLFMAMEHEAAGNYGSSLVKYIKAYNALLLDFMNSELDNFNIMAMNVSCFKIGMRLKANGFLRQAISYLFKVKDIKFEYKIEYINALVDNKDCRALYEIDSALSQFTERIFIKELKSLRAHTLYLMGDYDAAKKELNPMLLDPNPEFRKFAQKEMQQILSLQA